MRKEHAAALLAQGHQRRVVLHARLRDGHGVPPAHQVNLPNAAVDVGVHQRQVLQHTVAPGCGVVGQQRAALGHRQRVVGREHGGAGIGAQALVHGIDVAERGSGVGAAVRGGAGVRVEGGVVAHVVPTRRRAGPVEQRAVDVHIGHQPRRVLQQRGGLAQRVGRGFQHPRGNEQRQRQHHLLRRPGFDLRRGLVPGQHLHAVARFGHPQHGAATMDAAGQRRGQALHEPGVAVGPGEDRFAFRCAVAGRMKTVATGEVVQAGPGRHGAGTGAVVVAAAVVQIPAQAFVGEALCGQPIGKGLAV